jgi:hypothetical protein
MLEFVFQKVVVFDPIRVNQYERRKCYRYNSRRKYPPFDKRDGDTVNNNSTLCREHASLNGF